jgi:hypothetical protein
MAAALPTEAVAANRAAAAMVLSVPVMFNSGKDPPEEIHCINGSGENGVP